MGRKESNQTNNNAASRCHVKYFKDEPALESMAASQGKHLGVVSYILKMSQPLRVWQNQGVMLNIFKMSSLESMAACRCHVKYFKDESALVSMAASRCHVKSLKMSQPWRLWQHLGVMLNNLKMS